MKINPWTIFGGCMAVIAIEILVPQTAWKIAIMATAAYALAKGLRKDVWANWSSGTGPAWTAGLIAAGITVTMVNRTRGMEAQGLTLAGMIALAFLWRDNKKNPWGEILTEDKAPTAVALMALWAASATWATMSLPAPQAPFYLILGGLAVGLAGLGTATGSLAIRAMLWTLCLTAWTSSVQTEFRPLLGIWPITQYKNYIAISALYGGGLLALMPPPPAKHKAWRWADRTAILAAICAIVVTNSQMGRGGLLVFLLGLGWAWAMQKCPARWKQTAWLATLAAPLVGILGIVLSRGELAFRLAEAFNRKVNLGGRLDSWQVALDWTQLNPLTGQGCGFWQNAGTVARNNMGPYSAIDCDNGFLEVAVQSGWPASLLLAAVLVTAALATVMTLKNPKISMEKRLIGLGLAVISLLTENHGFAGERAHPQFLTAGFLACWLAWNLYANQMERKTLSEGEPRTKKGK
jgi:O-antigen ligase